MSQLGTSKRPIGKTAVEIRPITDKTLPFGKLLRSVFASNRSFKLPLQCIVPIQRAFHAKLMLRRHFVTNGRLVRGTKNASNAKWRARCRLDRARATYLFHQCWRNLRKKFADLVSIGGRVHRLDFSLGLQSRPALVGQA